MHLSAQVLDQRRCQLAQFVAAYPGQKVLGPRLRIDVAGALVEIRNRILGPPLITHKVRERHTRLDNAARKRAELLVAFDLPIECLGVAHFVE